MIGMFKALFRSFGYAFKGLFRTVKDERNFRIHLTAVFFVTWFAFLYEVTVGQAVVLVILYVLVLSLELVNTAVEKTVDLITPDRHPLAEMAKDASAGAVLIAAVAAVVVAVLMFRDPDHWVLVWGKIISPVRLIVFVVSVVLSLFFVRGKKFRK